MLHLYTVVTMEKYVCAASPELKGASVNDVFNSGHAYCFCCYSNGKSRCICSRKKKNLISLNNGMNKIRRNNRSWGRNYILYVLCLYTAWCSMMLLRESCVDINSSCSLYYRDCTVFHHGCIKLRYPHFWFSLCKGNNFFMKVKI